MQGVQLHVINKILNPEGWLIKWTCTKTYQLSMYNINPIVQGQITEIRKEKLPPEQTQLTREKKQEKRSKQPSTYQA